MPGWTPLACSSLGHARLWTWLAQHNPCYRHLLADEQVPGAAVALRESVDRTLHAYGAQISADGVPYCLLRGATKTASTGMNQFGPADTCGGGSEDTPTAAPQRETPPPRAAAPDSAPSTDSDANDGPPCFKSRPPPGLLQLPTKGGAAKHSTPSRSAVQSTASSARGCDIAAVAAPFATQPPPLRSRDPKKRRCARYREPDAPLARALGCLPER